MALPYQSSAVCNCTEIVMNSDTTRVSGLPCVLVWMCEDGVLSWILLTHSLHDTLMNLTGTRVPHLCEHKSTHYMYIIWIHHVCSRRLYMSLCLAPLDIAITMISSTRDSYNKRFTTLCVCVCVCVCVCACACVCKV